MTYSLLFVMDSIEHIKPYKDSTLAMMLAAQARGWQIACCDCNDLKVRGATAFAHQRTITVYDDPDHWYDYHGEQTWVPVTDSHAVLMRKDPPFDMNFIYATYALERAEQQGTLILNPPAALRDTNEKFAISAFPECTTDTLISAQRQEIRAFLAEHQDIIVKPLDGMGGQGIYRLRQDDPNINVILEMMTQSDQTPIMAQRYLAEIRDGDKRILVIDGTPLNHALARIPLAGETRGNLAAGGTGKVVPLSARDREIVTAVAPTLRQRGLVFVGLDVIGDYLTEINVTSPTCIREIAASTDDDAAARLMDVIAQRLG